MKAELEKITIEMTENEALTKTLNDNFDKLNDIAHKREMQIFNRLSAIEKSTTDLKKTNGDKFDLLNQNMTKLMRNFGLDPDTELLKG